MSRKMSAIENLRKQLRKTTKPVEHTKPLHLEKPIKRGVEFKPKLKSPEMEKKANFDDAFAHLLCPITHSLPVFPVLAEDGHIYEKEAIAKWLKHNNRSPLTNKRMGKSLRANQSVAHLIRSIVMCGEVSDEIASAWTEKIASENEKKKQEDEIKTKFNKTKRLAQNGDSDAMYQLAEMYTNNYCDNLNAFDWYLKSHTAGNTNATEALKSLAKTYVNSRSIWEAHIATNLKAISPSESYHINELNKAFDKNTDTLHEDERLRHFVTHIFKTESNDEH